MNKGTYKTINTYTEIKAKEQRQAQYDKYIHTAQNKRTKTHTRR